MYRQGDVLLVPVATKLPPQATKGDVTVLAHGEQTGHSHTLYGRARMYRDAAAATALLALEEDGELRHEEHGTIQVPAGNYEVRQQREHMPIRDRRLSD